MKRRVLFGILFCATSMAPIGLGQSMVPEGQALAAPTVGETASVQATIGADLSRDLYYVSDGTGEGKHPGLRLKAYQTVTTTSGWCETIQVPLGKIYTSGERVRFTVESNTKGFLYILQRGSSGAYNILFPVNNLPNEIRKGTEVPIPQTGSFQFDATPGTETLYFVLAKKKTNIFTYILPAAGGAAPPPPQLGSYEASILSAFQKGQKDLVITGPGVPASPGPNSAHPASAPTWNSAPFFAVAQSNKDFLVVPVQLLHR